MYASRPPNLILGHTTMAPLGVHSLELEGPYGPGVAENTIIKPGYNETGCYIDRFGKDLRRPSIRFREWEYGPCHLLGSNV